MGGSLECIFNTICGCESKWSPVMIIIGIIFCGIEGLYVPLDLFVDPHDHAIYLIT